MQAKMEKFDGWCVTWLLWERKFATFEKAKEFLKSAKPREFGEEMVAVGKSDGSFVVRRLGKMYCKTPEMAKALAGKSSQKKFG